MQIYSYVSTEFQKKRMDYLLSKFEEKMRVGNVNCEVLNFAPEELRDVMSYFASEKGSYYIEDRKEIDGKKIFNNHHIVKIADGEFAELSIYGGEVSEISCNVKKLSLEEVKKIIENAIKSHNLIGNYGKDDVKGRTWNFVREEQVDEEKTDIVYKDMFSGEKTQEELMELIFEDFSKYKPVIDNDRNGKTDRKSDFDH